MDSLSTLSKRTVIVALLLGLIAYPALLRFSDLNPSQSLSVPPAVKSVTSSQQLEATSSVVSPGVPVRLKIPAIGVNTILEQVGLTARGEVDVPKTYANAAWFNLWPRPGEKGSSVIVGHYGLINGTPSVFENLHKLQTGDKILVEDHAGVVISFVVRATKKFEANTAPPEVFRSSDNGAHLNLVTCEGTWMKTQQSFSNRLVVFTDKEVQ